MRGITGLLAASCWFAAAAASAQSACSPSPCPPSAPVEIQFNFTLDPGNPGAPPNVWNLPGPVPTSFQETFFVDPSSATGTYNTEPGPNGTSLLGLFTASFTATDLTLSANGQVLGQLASGAFTLSGDRATNSFGPAGSFFGGSTTPFGGGSTDFHSQFAQAPPDWAAFLGTSGYSVAPGLFELSGSFGQLAVVGQGQAIPASVPEPGALALFALAGLGLLVAHRRRFPSLRGNRRNALG